MKRFATEENEAIVAIPPVVETTIIVVQPQLVIVAINLEQVRVTIRVSNVQCAVRATTLRRLMSISELNRIPHHNAIALCTKFLHFLTKFPMLPLCLKP